MKKSLVIITLILVLTLSFLLTGCSSSSVRNMIGTTISLELHGSDSKRAEREIYDMILSVEEKVSTSLSSSTISRINKANAGETITLDDMTNTLISATYEYYLLTGGSFDISVFPLVDLWKFSPDKVDNMTKEPPSQEEIDRTIPLVGFDRAFTYDKDKHTITKNIDGAMLDLGAVAKGYIADKANEIVRRLNIKEAILNIGGTIYVHGDRTFKVGISHPRKSMASSDIIKIIEMKNKGVSTSGDYERYYLDSAGNRYHHIIDPHTGRPSANGIVSVTIVSRSAMLADILSTSVFVLGEEQGVELLSKIDKVDRAIVITLDGDKLTTHEYIKGKNI